MVIPERWSDLQVFYEKLLNPVEVNLYVNSHHITVLVEPTRPNYYHACSVEDIYEILRHIPLKDLCEIELVILRQPKRKEVLLRPVWGRFVYWADTGKYSGPAIYLESFEKNKIIKWDISTTPDIQKELQRLENDGHTIVRDKRYYYIHTTPESCRNTQLYRTLAHEIGHSVDYITHSLEPSVKTEDAGESDYITRKFDSKPTKDKEDFAHRYADTIMSDLRNSGVIPFKKILNDDYLAKHGLDKSWFSD